VNLREAVLWVFVPLGVVRCSLVVSACAIGCGCLVMPLCLGAMVFEGVGCVPLVSLRDLLRNSVCAFGHFCRCDSSGSVVLANASFCGLRCVINGDPHWLLLRSDLETAAVRL
jgi:hypothetical protein